MAAYFTSSVVRLGEEAPEMIGGGIMILFAEPLPDELADVSVIHAPDGELAEPIGTGDLLRVGESTLTITAVGERAAENLRSLGHLVVYVDPDASTSLLPGAVHAHGELTVPERATVIELSRPDETAGGR